jgi:hypothetical protein
MGNYARLTWNQWADACRRRYNAPEIEHNFRQRPDYRVVGICFWRTNRQKRFWHIFIRHISVHRELMEVILDAGYTLIGDRPEVKDDERDGRRLTIWRLKNRGGYYCNFNLDEPLPPQPKVTIEYLRTAPVGTMVTHEELVAAGFNPYGQYFEVLIPFLMSHLGPENPTRESCAIQTAMWQQCWRGQRRDDGRFGVKEGTIETLWKRIS